MEQIGETVEEGQVPKVYYHRKCRQLFTMKIDLDQLKLKDDNPDVEVKREKRRKNIMHHTDHGEDMNILSQGQILKMHQMDTDQRDVDQMC